MTMDHALLWEFPPEDLALPGDETHVWRADLHRTQRAEDWELLNPGERARAARYTITEARERYVTGRALLRRILARYVRCAPADIRFVYGIYGKPDLAEDQRDGVRFNMSDSHGMALFAVTRRRQVGVDIERMRDGVSYDRLAQRYFAPEEIAAFQALPRERRREAFFQGWARKEAYVKAIGLGLNFPLKDFVVELDPARPPALLSIAGRTDAARQWSLHALSAVDTCAAALVVEMPITRLRLWECVG